MPLLNPEQVLFHALKHHCKTVVDFISQHNGKPVEESIPMIKTMGASQFDFYTGLLTVGKLKEEIVNQLNGIGLTTMETYRGWLMEHNGYRVLTLSDHSEWTLRFADRENFIHLHPSRYSPHTIRIKANAMKTVIGYFLMVHEPAEMPDLAGLNYIREQYLLLSPLIAGKGNDEVYKVYRLVWGCLELRGF